MGNDSPIPVHLMFQIMIELQQGKKAKITDKETKMFKRTRLLYSTVNPEKQDISKVTSFYQLYARDIQGNVVPLSKYENNVLLVVNFASECGLTSKNYKQLQQLRDKYHDQGFEVLAFPCNQFGNQESGDNGTILKFARETMKVTYPMFSKVDVNGDNTHPIFQFLKRSYREYAGTGMFTTDKIMWNFGKFLVNRQGVAVQKYLPTTEPMSIEKDIQEELKKQN